MGFIYLKYLYPTFPLNVKRPKVAYNTSSPVYWENTEVIEGDLLLWLLLLGLFLAVHCVSLQEERASDANVLTCV